MDTRFRLAVITFVGVLAAAAWTLPYWWAVVNPGSSVAAGLPGLDLDERAAFAAFPSNIRAAYMLLYEGQEEDEIAPQPDWALSLVRSQLHGEDHLAAEGNQPFEPIPGSQMIVSGTFSGVNAVQQAQGTIMIYQNPDNTRLLRFDNDFTSTRAPGIHIILTRNPDPTDERGVGVDYIDIGLLRGNFGGQNYMIPQSADFARYPVLVLYSPQYDSVLATATLR